MIDDDLIKIIILVAYITAFGREPRKEEMANILEILDKIEGVKQ